MMASGVLALAAAKIYDEPHLPDGAQGERLAVTGGMYHFLMEEL